MTETRLGFKQLGKQQSFCWPNWKLSVDVFSTCLLCHCALLAWQIAELVSHEETPESCVLSGNNESCGRYFLFLDDQQSCQSVVRATLPKKLNRADIMKTSMMLNRKWAGTHGGYSHHRWFSDSGQQHKASTHSITAINQFLRQLSHVFTPLSPTQYNTQSFVSVSTSSLSLLICALSLARTNTGVWS